MIVKHPTLAVEKRIPDADADRWVAAGWLADAPRAALCGEQGHEPFVPCPKCGAVGDGPCMTAAGNATTRHAARA